MQSTSLEIVYISVVLVKVSINSCFFVDKITYKHIESVYLVFHVSFCQRNGNLYAVHYVKKYVSSVVYITMISWLCISLDRILISNVQILVNLQNALVKHFIHKK